MTKEHQRMEEYPLTPSSFARNVTNKFTAREGVFSEFRNVEDYVPNEADQLGQSRFLFYVVQLDYSMRGRVLYEGARNLFNENPGFFTPQYILNLSNAELIEILKTSMKPRYPNEAVSRYKQNSRKLEEEYEGDPMLIFTESTSATLVLEKIHEFRGMGPKIGNLFFRSMVSFFGLKYEDINSVLPPVDIHDVRIAHLLGFIEKPDMTDKNIQGVKILWSRACQEADVDWVIFDRALWLLGSGGKPKTKEDILNLIK